MTGWNTSWLLFGPDASDFSGWSNALCGRPDSCLGLMYQTWVGSPICCTKGLAPVGPDASDWVGGSICCREGLALVWDWCIRLGGWSNMLHRRPGSSLGLMHQTEWVVQYAAQKAWLQFGPDASDWVGGPICCTIRPGSCWAWCNRPSGWSNMLHRRPGSCLGLMHHTEWVVQYAPQMTSELFQKHSPVCALTLKRLGHFFLKCNFIS